MARPRITCTKDGFRAKTPHGLHMHDLRIHQKHNWSTQQPSRKRSRLRKAA